MKYFKWFAYINLLIGSFLLTVNLFGLTKDIRVSDFDNQYLRFENDQPADFELTLNKLARENNETQVEYASRVTKVVASGLSHIEWFKYPPQQFNQIIPIWENYFLYFMGKFSGIPEYERYHYANYERSLRRGIGLCGDASMVLSQLLEKQKIENRILTFPGHVLVLATFDDGKQYILDGDFGVVVPYSLAEVSDRHSGIAQLYLDAGYTQSDYNFFEDLFQKQSREWRGVEHFITNKYYFEKIAYGLKWPLPLIMIISSLWVLRVFFSSKISRPK